jgi:zona occludens toxin
MAIHIHEGLPGAGKSYEACVQHILPALKAGRQVVTNIRGINWAMFGKLLDEPEEYIRLLLTYIEPAEQDGESTDIQRCINDFANNTPDNAMVVWDEIQDYCPSGNYKMPINQQKFWTEHRHRGLEIVIMGQDRDDVHKLIRGRIEDVVYFLKLKAVGRPNQSKWQHFEKQSKGKFVMIGSGVRTYDSQYFGLYMTARREGVQKSVYTTGTSNVLKNSRMLSMGVPAVFIAAVYAVFHLYGFFHPTPKNMDTVAVVRPVETNPALVNPPPPDLHPVSQVNPPPGGKPAAPEVVYVDYLDKLCGQYLLRATGIIDSKKPGKELIGEVELLDDSYHVKERMNLDEIKAMGWTVTRTGYGILIEKQGSAHVVRTWPLDLYGRVDQRTVDSLGAGHAKQASSKTDQPAQTPLTVVNSGKPGLLW